MSIRNDLLEQILAAIGGGSGDDPTFTTLTEGQTAKANALGKLVYSGATVSPTTGEWTFDEAINVPAGTLNISDTLSISEATLVLFTRDNILKQNFVDISAKIDETGTGIPFMQEAPSVITVVAQPDDSTVITVNPIVIPILASFDNETDSILFRANGPMSNVRLTLTDNTTGVVLKYLPSKAAVTSGTGGMEFVAGENIINMANDDPDSPGVFNVGFTPLRLRTGEASIVLIEADSVDLLGNGSNIPYLENVIHPLFTTSIARQFDTSNIGDDYLRLNNEYTVASGTPVGLVATYLADATADTVTLGQFTAGVASTSNPTVITDSSDTFTQGDLIQIQSSILNSGIFEVEDHTGTLLTVRGVGTVPIVEGFTRSDFVATISDATITKINVSIIRSGVNGEWEQGAGSETGITFEAMGDMLKSVYDTSNLGIVDGSQKITDFAILDEDVTQGDLLYIVDAPLSPEGFPTMGIADSETSGKRPAAAVVTETALMGAQVQVIQNGFASGLDTSSFSVNQEVHLSRDGKITSKTKKYRQEVGIVKDVDNAPNGSILFKQGDVLDHGKLLGYAQDSGGISLYTSTPEFGGSVRRQVFQEAGPSQPQSMVTTAVHVDEVQQPVKIANTANPSFTLTPTNNNNILGFTLEAATTITNVIMEVFAGPTLIWQNNVGELIADVETSFSLTADQRIPIDLFSGVPYAVNFSSDDGDVVLKGTVGGDPFYALTWDDFVFEDLVTLPQLDIANTLVHGGLISENTTTTIDVSAGAGRIITVDGLGNPSITDVSWADQINIAIPDIGTNKSTRIGFDSTGTLVQIPFELTPSVLRNYIVVGFIIHPSGTIAGVSNDGLKAQTLYSQLVDHLETLGVTRKSGLAITPDTGLSIGKSAGILESPGAGTGSGNAGQNIVDITADPSAATFSRILQDGTVETASTTVLDPGFYDNGGVKTALPQANDASIVYVYQAIEDVTGGLIIAYGQTVYPNIQDAEQNADTDPRVIPVAIEQRTNLIARIVLRSDATDVTDIGDAVFLSGAKFGVDITGGSLASGSGGGDVSGPASSQLNEIPSYTDASGKIIEATSDVSILNGIIDRMTVNEDLWVRINSTQENVIIGRHIDFTGVPNLNNTTLLITANSTNDVVFSTLGNNSQSIAFVKNGVFRGQVNNNRDRNSVGLQNAVGDYIEIRPDGDVYHSNRSISATKAYAEDTASNTDVTTLPGSNSYAQCDFGPNFVERIGHGFVLNGSRFQNTGPAFKGVVTFSVDIANSANVDILYDLRISINNTTNLVGIWRQLFVFPGKPSHALVDAYVELATNDFVQLNIKQPNGALFHPTLRRNTLKIE